MNKQDLKQTAVGILGGILISLVMHPAAWAQEQDPSSASRQTVSTKPTAQQQTATAPGTWDYVGPSFSDQQWTGGFGMGILGSTPDGNALALNANLDYFANSALSLGPLLQLGFTDDMTQVGLSGQAKYWLPLPGTNNRSRVNLQSGLGFVHSDYRSGDTSWLVPIGLGYDYEMDSGVQLTATALINFTDLNAGRGSEADVMPGFVFGARF